MAADAALQVRGLWEDALNIGEPNTHLVLAAQQAFEQTLGQIGDNTEATLSTIADIDYEPGDTGRCEEEGPGLYFSLTSEASHTIAAPSGDYWVRWGSTLVDDTGSVFDISNCDEDYVPELVLEPPIHTLSTKMNTAPLNNLHNALSGNLRLHQVVRFGGSALAASIGWASSRQGDLFIDIVPTLPPFLSPEWHPQIGHWEITITDLSHPADPLMVAYASAVSGLGLDEMDLIPDDIDDQLQTTGIDAADIVVNILPQGGTVRFPLAAVQTHLIPLLKQTFADHVQSVIAHMGFPEWANNVGEPPFSDIDHLDAHWADNYVFYR